MLPAVIKNVGFIGTGVMGKSMCKYLLKAGYSLAVYNRTASKADELVELGAKFLTPRELAAGAELVFMMVGYPSDVEEMALTKEAIVDHLKPGSILVDHTTSSPTLAKKIYEECKKRGVYSIDAPVSGGDIGAREGRLVVMAGGDQEAFDLITPVLKAYSQKLSLFGGAGAGQHVKVVNQTTICTNMIGVVEGLIYGYKAGVDLHKVLELIGGGAAASFSLNVVGPRILKRDFDPGFYVDHFVKDLGIALEEARQMNLSLPGVALAQQFYIMLQAQGDGKLSTASLIKIFEKINNIDMSKEYPKK